MLRNIVIYLFACLLPIFGNSQFIFKGKITAKGNTAIPAVMVQMSAKNGEKTLLKNGEFSFNSKQKIDTIYCFAEGYDSAKFLIKSWLFNNLILKEKITAITKEDNKSHLSSLTPNLVKDADYYRYMYNETYSSMVENNFVDATKFPVTAFSPNTNKASYSNIRRFINNQVIMPTDAVRIEEILNYFSLPFAPKPSAGNSFGLRTQLATCPWNNENLLLFIGAQARKMDLDKVPPSNLVFLIDNSGSMDQPNRLPLIKDGFKLMVENLRSIDTIAIITYGGMAQIMLGPTGGDEKAKIIEAIEGLSAGGETPGSSGLKLAYQIAQTKFKKDGNNRVVLATDGDFNVGQINDKELEDLIKTYRNTGIYLTCLGVGMGNYKDSKLETLARYGNGNFAYLDNESEAEKVLVKEFAQTMVPIASNVTLHIKFNPQWVKKYRLIGFDNRQDALADTINQLVGGEIGSGHNMLAMVEITPQKTLADWSNLANEKTSFGNLELHYQLPSNELQMNNLLAMSAQYLPFEKLDSTLRFATSLAMFGTLVKQSKVVQTINFEEVITMTNHSYNIQDLLQKEYLELLQKAILIYDPKQAKKKKKKH